jgi:hypothetical protein
MMLHVLSEVDIINEFLVFSDRCSNKDYEKCVDEFERDLKTKRFKHRFGLKKFCQGADKSKGNEEESEK